MLLRSGLIVERSEATVANMDDHASPNDSTRAIAPSPDTRQSGSSSNSQDSTRTIQDLGGPAHQNPTTPRRSTRQRQTRSSDIDTPVDDIHTPRRFPTPPPRNQPPPQPSLFQQVFTNPPPTAATTSSLSATEEPWNSEAAPRNNAARLREFERRLSGEHKLGELRQPEYTDKLGTEIEGLGSGSSKRKVGERKGEDEDGDEDEDEDEDDESGEMRRRRAKKRRGGPLRELRPRPSKKDGDRDHDGQSGGLMAG